MPPEDFGAAVPLAPLRTAVPSRYSPMRVQHIDCIVLYSVDNQAKAQVCFANISGILLRHSILLPSHTLLIHSYLSYSSILKCFFDIQCSGGAQCFEIRTLHDTRHNSNSLSAGRVETLKVSGVSILRFL